MIVIILLIVAIIVFFQSFSRALGKQKAAAGGQRVFRLFRSWLAS